MIPMSLSSAIASLVALLAVYAAIWDLYAYRIPNHVSIGVVGLFVAFALTSNQEVIWWQHLVAALSMFALGFTAFAFGLFGGGDVKFLAAAALWSGFTHLPDLVTVTAFAGGLFALLLLFLRWILPRLVPRLAGSRHLPEILRTAAPVPYGVAIAGGLLAVVSGELPGVVPGS